jgi:hypothetical protein
LGVLKDVLQSRSNGEKKQSTTILQIVGEAIDPSLGLSSRAPPKHFHLGSWPAAAASAGYGDGEKGSAFANANAMRGLPMVISVVELLHALSFWFQHHQHGCQCLPTGRQITSSTSSQTQSSTYECWRLSSLEIGHVMGQMRICGENSPQRSEGQEVVLLGWMDVDSDTGQLKVLDRVGILQYI